MRRFTSRGSSGSTAKKEDQCDAYLALFDQFKDDESEIGPGGIERLCSAMDLDPSEVQVLVLAWCLGANKMGYFSREQWTSGAPKLGAAGTAEALKERLGAVHNATLRDIEKLRDLHKFAHKFCRENERRKNIDLPSALAMLSLLLQPLYPEHVAEIAEYLNQHKRIEKAGLSMDEWTMMLQFFREIKPDCSNYQDDGAWPLMLDEYVEWQRAKRGE